MRFVFLIIGLILFFPIRTLGQTSLEQDLLMVANQLKSMERRYDLVQGKLNELYESRQAQLNVINNSRYSLAKTGHAYYSLFQRQPYLVNFTKSSNYTNRYFERQYYKQIKAIIESQMKNEIGKLVAIENTIAEINQFEIEQQELQISLQTGFDYLEKNRNSHVDDEMVANIKQVIDKSRSLNDFINNLLEDDQKLASYKDKTFDFILPVAGIVRKRNPGLAIEINQSAIIVAPEDGKILFAGDYKHLGPLIIVDHGNQYISILRGFSKALVNTGRMILQGDPIGYISNNNAGKNAGENQIGTMFYYELRYNGAVINPLEKISGL